MKINLYLINIIWYHELIKYKKELQIKVYQSDFKSNHKEQTYFWRHFEGDRFPIKYNIA